MKDNAFPPRVRGRMRLLLRNSRRKLQMVFNFVPLLPSLDEDIVSYLRLLWRCAFTVTFTFKHLQSSSTQSTWNARLYTAKDEES